MWYKYVVSPSSLNYRQASPLNFYGQTSDPIRFFLFISATFSSGLPNRELRPADLMHEQPLANGDGACASAPVIEPTADEHVPRYEVTEFTFSDQNTDSEFIVMCSGKRLVIRLFADHLSESPHLKEQYLFFL